MRSIATKVFFNNLGMKQLFSRPRTPNDNPQIESLFSTVKHVPKYPERFETISQAEKYFEEFFTWYNYEHYHTSIGMVTPNDRHTGNDMKIFNKRDEIKTQTFKQRRLHHCKI
jgi:transposase InsO family protein